ncbi:MAG TPA: hypothetical protein VN672_10040 [Solirubrobacteraceae bacterium]|nr:hypothetical protein [Solirubrobacteraceae bacterium]
MLFAFDEPPDSGVIIPAQAGMGPASAATYATTVHVNAMLARSFNSGLCRRCGEWVAAKQALLRSLRLRGFHATLVRVFSHRSDRTSEPDVVSTFTNRIAVV